MHRLMLVDDEAIIATQLEELLTPLGYEVAGMACSGEEAVGMAKDLKPDLILMDIFMPGVLDGIAAAEKIKAELGIPVIFLTGYADEELINRAKSLEPLGYVLKPFRGEQIRVTIEIALYKNEMEEALRKAHEELEGLVEERTAELVGANKQLRAEIEERKQAQEALRESEEKYKTLTESSLTGIYIHQDGRYVFVNDRFAQIHGYKPDELLGEHYLTLIHPDETERVKQIGSKRLKGEPAPRRYEVKRLRKDGEAVWCETIAVRIEYRGKPAIIGNIVDINEHKLAEEAVKREKERAEEYLNIAGVMLAVVSADENIALINNKGCEILGYNEGELIGGNWFDILVPERIRSEIRGVFGKLMAGEIEPVEYYENPLLTKDGKERLISFHNTVITNPNGQIVGVLFSGEDITERVQAEKTLMESEAQKKAILDGSIDRIRLADKDMRIIWANKTTVRELNIPPEDLEGEFCYKIFSDRDTPCPDCQSKKAFKSGNIEHAILYRPKLKDIEGETYWDAYAVPIKDESGDIVNMIEIARNITEQVQGEQALREREAELEIKTNSLEEMNTALRVLLERRHEDKRELEEKVLLNVKELVVPFLEKVKKAPLDPRQVAYIDILESNLNDIVSPFLRTLSSKYSNLTPTEIRVAHLIRESKTTKEIGEVMTLSPRTIETHRKNMRKKLGIEKNKGNLRFHLLSLQ